MVFKKPLDRLKYLNTKECLWIYILRILLDKSIHAYLIRKKIEKKFGFKSGTVTAYRVLYSLRSKGLVGKTSEGRRKVYKITEKGKEELKKAIKFYKNQIKILEK